MKNARTFTIEVGRWNQTVVRPAHMTAFGVALEFFADVLPGEHDKGNTYRFRSPKWGWVYVTWRETNEDDHIAHS